MLVNRQPLTVLTSITSLIACANRVGRSPLRDTLDRLLADGHHVIGDV